MITNRTASIAVKLTRTLMERHGNKIALEAIEGSPVDQLMDASNTPVDEGVSMEELIDSVREASLVDVHGGGSEHDLVMEESSSAAIKAINSSVEFARNVLRPATDKVESGVREALANATPVRYYVEPYFMHDIFFSSHLKESVGRFDNSPNDTLVRMSLPALTEADVTALLSTGVGGWDSVVSEWLATKPEGWLLEVYTRVFGSLCETNHIADYQNPLKVSIQGGIQLEPGLQREDFLLAAFLLANALCSSPMSVDKTGTEWRSILTTWVQQLGIALNATVERAAGYMDSGRLVIHWPLRNQVWLNRQEDGKITVLGNAYNAWLGKGGSPEILIGVLFSGVDRMPIFAGEIDEQRDSFLREYHRYEEILAREVANRANDLIGQAFQTALLMALSDATVDQLPVGIEVEELRGHLLEKVKAIPRWESVDIYRKARELLALYVFCKPTALHILESMDELMDADGELDGAEAAYMVIQEYVAKYVGNQVAVRPVEQMRR